MKPSYDTVACERFLYDYGFAYELLYESDRAGGLVDYGKAVDEYYELIRQEDFEALAMEFCDFRRDFMTSDRECAAFVLALKANGMF